MPAGLPAPPLPLPNTYWVEPGRLLAGEYPGDRVPAAARLRLQALLAAGLTCFIDLTEPGEAGTAGALQPYAALLQQAAAARGAAAEHVRFPIPDGGTPASPGVMTAILDRLDQAAAAPIYLHCWGGVGRTGTVVGCYLVRHGRSGPAALDQLADWWRRVPKSAGHPRSPETDAQRAYVLGWAERAGRR